MTRSRNRPLTRSVLALTAIVVVSGVVATGCGSKQGETSTGSTSAPSSTGNPGTSAAPTSLPPDTKAAQVVGPGEVTIKDYDFVPNSVTVKPGTTVTWTDEDTADHWVVSAPASPQSFDLGRQGTGKAVTHTFTQSGTYPYYCNLHNYMKGTVIVP